MPQPETDTTRVQSLDRGDPLFEGLVRGAAIALERELDVLGGDRLAVVELHAAAQDELVREPIGGYGPRLGERRRQRVAGQRLQHRVVESVEHHERRDDPGGFGWIEPRRSERDVDAPGHLAVGRGGSGSGGGRRDQQNEDGD